MIFITRFKISKNGPLIIGIIITAIIFLQKNSTQAQLDRMESQIAMLISILSNNSSGGFSKDIVKKYHS